MRRTLLKITSVSLEATAVEDIRRELEQVILKVNYHFHSGYEGNDLRLPQSIFLNFFKKSPSIIHSAYLLRLKNRDFKLSFDGDNFVDHIQFIDHAYETFNGMTTTIKKLNEACLRLDYDDLRERTNTQAKYLQIADKDIQFLKDFKFT